MSAEELIIMAISLGLLGIIMVVMSICVRRWWKKKEGRCTGRAVGTVVEVIEKIERSGEFNNKEVMKWTATYEYYVNGKYIKSCTKEKVGESPLHEGQQVIVYYNPDNVNDCILEEQHGEKAYRISLFIGMAFFIGAVVFAIIGLNM